MPLVPKQKAEYGESFLSFFLSPHFSESLRQNTKVLEFELLWCHKEHSYPSDTTPSLVGDQVPGVGATLTATCKHAERPTER